MTSREPDNIERLLAKIEELEHQVKEAKAILFEALVGAPKDATLVYLAKEMVWWVGAIRKIYESLLAATRAVLPHMHKVTTVDELAIELVDQWERTRTILQGAAPCTGSDTTFMALTERLVDQWDKINPTAKEPFANREWLDTQSRRGEPCFKRKRMKDSVLQVFNRGWENV